MALSEDGRLQQLNLKCTIDEKINGIMSTMSSFVSVSIEACPQSVVIKTMNAKRLFVFPLRSLTPQKVVLKDYLFLT
jgi:hypothetical protein